MLPNVCAVRHPDRHLFPMWPSVTEQKWLNKPKIPTQGFIRLKSATPKGAWTPKKIKSWASETCPESEILCWYFVIKRVMEKLRWAPKGHIELYYTEEISIRSTKSFPGKTNGNFFWKKKAFWQRWRTCTRCYWVSAFVFSVCNLRFRRMTSGKLAIMHAAVNRTQSREVMWQASEGRAMQMDVRRLYTAMKPSCSGTEEQSSDLFTHVKMSMKMFWKLHSYFCPLFHSLNLVHEEVYLGEHCSPSCTTPSWRCLTKIRRMPSDTLDHFPMYRWVSLYPNMLHSEIEVSKFFSKLHLSFFICLFNLNFTLFKRILLGVTFCEFSGRYLYAEESHSPFLAINKNMFVFRKKINRIFASEVGYVFFFVSRKNCVWKIFHLETFLRPSHCGNGARTTVQQLHLWHRMKDEPSCSFGANDVLLLRQFQGWEMIWKRWKRNPSNHT